MDSRGSAQDCCTAGLGPAQGVRLETSTTYPKPPCCCKMYTWALRGLQDPNFGVSVCTIKLHGGFGVGKFSLRCPSVSPKTYCQTGVASF